MATFGVSMPEELQARLDQIANKWYTNRSQAIIRIFHEWLKDRNLLELDQTENPTAEMRASGAKELFPAQ